MEIEVTEAQGRVPIAIFKVKGRIDIDTADELERQAREAHGRGVHHMLLDLTEASYVSSAGVRVLNILFNLLREKTPADSDEAIRQGLRDGTLRSPHVKLLGVQPRVQQVLHITGTDMLFEVHTDLQAAVASF